MHIWHLHPLKYFKFSKHSMQFCIKVIFMKYKQHTFLLYIHFCFNDFITHSIELSSDFKEIVNPEKLKKKLQF